MVCALLCPLCFVAVQNEEELKMEWTPENVARKNFGGASVYVAGPGKQFLLDNQNGFQRRLGDFGVFYGRNLPSLIEVANGGQVIGVDHPNARSAVKRAALDFPAVTFVEAAMAIRIPLADNIFTGGLCWRVLHNLGKPGELQQALGELRRVLALGAPLLVSVRGKEERIRCCTEPVLLEQTDGAGGTRHDLYFSQLACRLMFTRAGFEVEGAVRLITESGTSDGNPYSNDYCVIHLVRI